MKILRIRLKNLNSLQGEHVVDLTVEPLASAGLFAITGATGAGKTTLLDAITLALYGKAARYGSEANPEHVMSRHCAECMAEVEFEVSQGVFRAVWERRRARKKADGALQQPKRYIYDQAGVPLTQQIREAEEKIEELLGLNYDRFLRSVLLAQGEFARFLKASANERAELLESLTGTEIYSRLGRLAFQEANRREMELLAKEEAIGRIKTLPEEERRLLAEAISQGEREYERRGQEIDAGAAMRQQIDQLEELRRKEKRAVDDQGRIATDRSAAVTGLERLRRHRLTLPFAEDLVRFASAEAAAQAATSKRNGAEGKHAEAQKGLRKANGVLRSAVATALEAQRNKARQATATVQQETVAADQSRGWLEAHEADALLAGQLGDLVAAIGELKSGRVLLTTQWANWRTVATKMLPAEAQELPASLETTNPSDWESTINEFLGQAGKKQAGLEAAAKDAEEQHGLRKDHLKKAILIAKLEVHRHDLQPNEPCPLCGALAHPYAEGAVPNAEITTLEAEVRKANNKYQEVQAAAHTLVEKIQDLTTDRINLRTPVRDCNARVKALAALLKPLGETVPPPGSEDTLRRQIQERERAYSTRVTAQKEAIQRKLAAEREAVKAAAEAAQLEQKLATLKPLSAAAELEALAVRDLPSVSVADTAYSACERQEEITANEVQGRIQDDQFARDALNKLTGPLAEAVTGTEFKELASLRQARLAAEEARKLEALDAELKNRTTAAKALLDQAREDIAKLLDHRVLEGEAAEAFKIHQTGLKKAGEACLAELTTQRNQLQLDDENQARRQESEKDGDQARASVVVWQRLRELIGSQDGSKFRRYAQTISLDILSRHANRHLAKLNDRYCICRDESEALNLQIEDLHQAGVRRPMASLSGGESFLASLALALGLSDIAGRTVRIDSLFIDEGFGGLDAETLEVAIAALESLRQDHKTVGIISHVGLLKERISTQIVVDKLAGGVSRIRVVADGTSL